MPQAFTATYRIHLTWTMDTQPHSLNAFVKISNASATPPTIKDRSNADVDWDDAAQGLADSLAYSMDQNTSAMQATLQHLVNGAWQPVDAASLTITPSSFEGNKGGQVTVTLRDTTFDKVKVVFLEPFWDIPSHYTDPLAGSANVDNTLKQFTPAHTVNNAPFLWMVSRSQDYLHATAAFVAATGALNRKVRRARNLA